MTQNVIHITRRPSTATTTTPHDLANNTAENMAAMAAHQEAENALAMALHYLRLNACNVPGATRKAVQALSALKRLHTTRIDALQAVPNNMPAPAVTGAYSFSTQGA